MRLKRLTCVSVNNGTCYYGQATGYASGGVEEALEERGVESLPFGGKRLLTETNGQRIGGLVQRLVATGRSSVPPSPCKDVAVSPLRNGR